MKALIYGINFKPEMIGIGKYSGELFDWLSKKATCRVITAPPYYPAWKISEFKGLKYHVQKHGDCDIIRCPIYVPEKPNAKRRILHLMSFALSSIPALAYSLFWKPDVVILVVPTFFCSPIAYLYAKLTGAKSVIHIQDYELDAMINLGWLNSSNIKNIAFKLEQIMLKRFDLISTISPKMCELAKDKTERTKPVYEFINWVDTQLFSPVGLKHIFRKKWGVKDDEIMILYSGNLGEKQGLDMLIRIAENLKEHPIKFFIVGNGASKEKLMEAAKDLEKVSFYPLQELEDLPDLFRSVNLHLIIEKSGFSNLVLPSKLGPILAMGSHCVITADPGTSLANMVESNPGIAHLIPQDNEEAMQNKLLELSQHPDIKNHRPNLKARAYAFKHLEQERVLSKFYKKLTELTQS